MAAYVVVSKTLPLYPDPFVCCQFRPASLQKYTASITDVRSIDRFVSNINTYSNMGRIPNFPYHLSSIGPKQRQNQCQILSFVYAMHLCLPALAHINYLPCTIICSKSKYVFGSGTETTPTQLYVLMCIK